MSEPRVLRPLGYGELFNEAFDLYKQNFVLLAGIGAVVFIPYSILLALAKGSPTFTSLLGVLFMVPMVAASGACVKAIADRYLGREATIADSWRFMRGRLWVFLLTLLLASLAVMGGLLLLIIPGVIVALRISVLTGVMVVEEKYKAAAFRRCGELAKGHYARLFVVGVVLALLVQCPAMLVQGLAEWAGMSSAALSVGAWIAALIGGIVNAVVHPLNSLLQVLLYFDLRVRNEGYDVELLAREMGVKLPAESAPALV
jgi:hypothetical protein